PPAERRAGPPPPRAGGGGGRAFRGYRAGGGEACLTSRPRFLPPPLGSGGARPPPLPLIRQPPPGKTPPPPKPPPLPGAIHLAGSVKARRARRHATSDWMELEKERGISVTSSVLQFEYRNHAVNLLDTPGHQDFSEDTYRTLSAADSAVMLIDAAKGVE